MNLAAQRTDILLTGAALVAACTPATKALFLNCFAGQKGESKCAGWSPTAVADAVDATKGGLQVFSCVEGEVSGGDLTALANCTGLRGLLIDQCRAGSTGGALSDAAMASLLRASPHLRWLWVGGVRPAIFGDLAWAALASGSCPHLELLWIDQSRPGEMIGRSFAAPAAVRRALGPGTALARSLQVCMINPDTKAKSRYILGGTGKAADRLDGKKLPPINYGGMFW